MFNNRHNAHVVCRVRTNGQFPRSRKIHHNRGTTTKADVVTTKLLEETKPTEEVSTTTTVDTEVTTTPFTRKEGETTTTTTSSKDVETSKPSTTTTKVTSSNTTTTVAKKPVTTTTTTKKVTTTTTAKKTTTTTKPATNPPVTTSIPASMLPAIESEYTVEVFEDAVISDLNNSGAFIIDMDVKYSNNNIISEDDIIYVYGSYNARIMSLIPTTLTVTIIWSQDNIDGKIHETVTKTVIHVV